MVGRHDYKALADADVVELLSSWQRLNDDLLQLSEAAIEQLIAAEMAGKKRPMFLKRLHHRFNRLRLVRERNLMSIGDLSWLQQRK